MIYTVGDKHQYDKYISEDPNPRKGKSGSVWKTLQEAQKYLTEHLAIKDYEIYGVVADWELDTEEIRGESWRSLKRAADIIVL